MSKSFNKIILFASFLGPVSAFGTVSYDSDNLSIQAEKLPVIQSVATSIQNNVIDLAFGHGAKKVVEQDVSDTGLTSGDIWARGLFNETKYQNRFDGYMRGVSVGVDGIFDKYWFLGAGYSYAHSNIDTITRDMRIDSSTLFVYGQYKPAQWYVNAVASYTMSDYSESGNSNGTRVAADYDIDVYGGALAVGYDFPSGITHEIGLRYTRVDAENYVNSVGVKNKLKDGDFMTAVAGTKYVFDVKTNYNIVFVPHLNMVAKYDLISDKQNAIIKMPGIDKFLLNGKRLSRFGGDFGIGLGIKYRGVNLSLDYDLDVRENYTSQTGMLNFKCGF